ncbi:invasion associated locus B family protein [Mesorhizobium sp. CAU 1741]|uniref:invasion associated locus B family protein n=1 Tax=Mesorhizobium sp. CAU 1741 TaxID=3140366 RepID=UPI00325B70ED
MNRRKTNATRLSLLAAGIAAIFAGATMPASAQQQQQQQLPEGWFKACSKQEDIDICNVQNILVADTGQLLTGVSLIEVKGKTNRRIFQITVPTGRLVPPGVGMQIDGGQPQKIDYMICLPDRCIAEGPLNDELVASFKRGSELTLTSVNFQNQPNPIKVSLAGFTAAFDGEPLQQADIEDRQKRIQDFVNRNTEDFAEKLREEQEKAKQGN